MPIRKVKYALEPDDRPLHEEPCPDCGGPLRFGPIPCRAGEMQVCREPLRPTYRCAVLRLGWMCEKCDTIWQEVGDAPGEG